MKFMIKNLSIFSTLLFIAAQPSAEAVELQYLQTWQSGAIQINGSYAGSLSNTNNYRLPSAINFVSTYSHSDYASEFLIDNVTSTYRTAADSKITAGTRSFNPTTDQTYQDVGTTVTVVGSSGNPIQPPDIIHNYTVNSEQGFSLESALEWDGNDPFLKARVNQTVIHYYDADPDSPLYQAADWMDDFNAPDLSISKVGQKAINALKSLHILNEEGKNLFIKKKTTVLGVRGSIQMDGTSIFTASPGTLAYDLTLPGSSEFNLPFAFTANKDEATLDAYFDGLLLGSISGNDYTLDELAFMSLDITGLEGQTGLLEFIINTTGAESANVFIPNSISSAYVSAVPVPAAVWLFGSGLLGLIGVARRKKAA